LKSKIDGESGKSLRGVGEEMVERRSRNPGPLEQDFWNYDE
jgi:hypothetical protein